MTVVGAQKSGSWHLGVLPFQIGHRPSPSNAPLPDVLPFTVAIDEQSGLIIQRRTAQVSDALTAAYRLGSQLGTPLSLDGMGRAQLDDVCSFITDAVPRHRDARVRVLEIGCGDGSLLVELAARSFEVVGVEPGEAAADAARARGFNVRCESFDSERFGAERFDLIVHHGVLEHIQHPLEFIMAQLGLLADGGRIVCCVPDCAPAIEHGDLSMLVHQHWSYFDQHALTHFGAAAGARTVALRRSRTAGAIYCAWEARRTAVSRVPPVPPFISRAKRSLQLIGGLVADAAGSHRSLGIFCGGRFINYYAKLSNRRLPSIRWFDDDPALHGRFYPPLPLAVEGRAALLSQPVDDLLIASWTFGDRLRDQLINEPALARTRIRTIAEIV